MQVKREQLGDTSVKLTVIGEQSEIESTKAIVLKRLGKDVKVPGFRPGKAPESLVEKNISQPTFQSEFLDECINQLYVLAVQEENLRPVAQPQINLTKFVPFTVLEFTATVEVVGEIKLPDYKKIRVEQKTNPIMAKDVDQVLDNLLGRAATKEEVKRAAKLGDEVFIDFTGNDTKTKEPISGADGKDYALILGSGTFIPGFEDKLVGVKPNSEIKLDLTFPEDYSVKSLQNRKVTFDVRVQKVSEVIKPKLDDAFAATVGPFKTVAELKTDVKKQITAEREREDIRAYDNQIVEKIAEKSHVAIPKELIEEEIDRMEEEEKRNIAYRGQTWQEHLDDEGLSVDEHREKQRQGAEVRVKAGLVLSEIANAEKIGVSSEELEMRMQLLKGQYPDPSMQLELDKPESRRDIMSRMLTEKTLDKLRKLTQK
jgi:trigger factor